MDDIVEIISAILCHPEHKYWPDPAANLSHVRLCTMSYHLLFRSLQYGSLFVIVSQSVL